MTTDTRPASEHTAGCLLWVFVVAVGVLLRGTTLKYFWNWYIAPVISAHLLNWPQALGVSLFAALFVSAEKADKTKSVLDGATEAAGNLLIRYGTAWLLACILHWTGGLP